jgi:DNA-binding NtrC family response regulator
MAGDGEGSLSVFGIIAATPKPRTMKKLRDKSVLVVDDDAGMLRALDKVLSGEGAIVICADCAGDAMEILTARQKRIDLVITDLRMPFVTGLTVLYAIHEIFPALPVIVLTAFGSPDVKAECLSQGAAAILEKPLDTPQLLAAIEDALAPRRPIAGTTTGMNNQKGSPHENNNPRKYSRA